MGATAKVTRYRWIVRRRQATADERIPLLLQTPAAVRWVSYEPALGPIDFKVAPLHQCPDGTRWMPSTPSPTTGSTGLHWLVVGGESGPGARPPHPDWFRAARDHCLAAGVPFFFKQWGEWAPVDAEHPMPMDRIREAAGVRRDGYRLTDDDVITPDTAFMWRHGKKAAGRRLDGREWNEFPRQGGA